MIKDKTTWSRESDLCINKARKIVNLSQKSSSCKKLRTILKVQKISPASLRQNLCITSDNLATKDIIDISRYATSSNLPKARRRKNQVFSNEKLKCITNKKNELNYSFFMLGKVKAIKSVTKRNTSIEKLRVGFNNRK